MCELLVKRGADVNASDHQDRSALMLAAADGQLATVELLLAEGGLRGRHGDWCWSDGWRTLSYSLHRNTHTLQL